VLKVIQGHNQAMLKGFFFGPRGEGWSCLGKAKVGAFIFLQKYLCMNSL
jgi:hypothetical protein